MKKMEKSERKPIAVLTADVHYNLNTLKVADAAMRLAISKANELQVPFIVAGDLHDTKAMLRGECINAMIDTFKTCKVPSYVIVGNHCRINERDGAHSLEFLEPYVTYVIDGCRHITNNLNAYLIPYEHDVEGIKSLLSTIPDGSLVIMHQGVSGADMGHYIQDKSSIPRDCLSNFRTISGHYHRAQDIKCGRPRKGAVGLFSYIGNPYTLSFGEAKDGPKGFQILYNDGLLEQVPTKLRKHVVVETDIQGLDLYIHTGSHPKPEDLLWLKVTGPKSELAKLDKKSIGEALLGHSNFKLDLITTDYQVEVNKNETLNDTDVLDGIIDSLSESDEYKSYLKQLWRDIV